MSDSTADRVLVVEDSATQAAALESLLTVEGFQVHVAKSAEHALAELDRSKFDLVLSDIVMPGMDGYELCRRIRATPGLDDLPVVLLTSLNDPLAIVRGLAAGAHHYVTKPFELEGLLNRIRQVLGRADEPRPLRPDPITVNLLGTPFTIRATKEQILELLVSSYSDLVRTSEAVREAERRARFLADAGELLSSSLDAHEVLRQLAQLAVPRIADVCAVDLMDASGGLRRVEIAHVAGTDRKAAAAPQRSRPPSEISTSVARALEESASQIFLGADHRALRDVALDDAVFDHLTKSAHTLMVVPLIARGRVIGVLQFVLEEKTRQLGPEDRLLFEDLARRAALAVDNALLYGEAQRATRARDDVLAIVSHDLRNPLNTIQMSTSFLLDVLHEPLDLSVIVPQLQVIRRATFRSNALIQDLLDVSRIDAGTLAVASKSVSAAALLQDAATEQEPTVVAAGLTLESSWIGPDVVIQADRSRVGQVFSNLVGNAAKFTAAGGRVIIKGEAFGKGAQFVVTDTGRGINAEHLPHLFDRFWQATQSTRAGAGLGLFIVKGIVEAHGGVVEVHSAPNEGTSFRFTLPE